MLNTATMHGLSSQEELLIRITPSNMYSAGQLIDVTFVWSRISYSCKKINAHMLPCFYYWFKHCIQTTNYWEAGVAASWSFKTFRVVNTVAQLAGRVLKDVICHSCCFTLSSVFVLPLSHGSYLKQPFSEDSSMSFLCHVVQVMMRVWNWNEEHSTSMEIEQSKQQKWIMAYIV